DFGPTELSYSGAWQIGNVMPSLMTFFFASPTATGGGEAVRWPTTYGARLDVEAALDWMDSSVIYHLWEPPRQPISNLELIEGPVVLRGEVHQRNGKVHREELKWRIDANDAL